MVEKQRNRHCAVQSEGEGRKRGRPKIALLKETEPGCVRGLSLRAGRACQFHTHGTCRFNSMKMPHSGSALSPLFLGAERFLA